MEKKVFTYGKFSYEYFFIRQNRKTLSLTVYPNFNIALKCPLEYSEEKIVSFLKRKWLWLEKQLKDFRKYSKRNQKKEYVSGESFLYLGRQYKLVIQKGEEDTIRVQSGRIVLKSTKDISDTGHNKKQLEKWYEKRAKAIFEKQYQVMLKKFNYDFVPELSLRRMEKRWGSFLSHKKILLNPELIKAAKNCIDYVIVHELCHMKYKNHNSSYYKFLKTKMADWEKWKERLELRFAQ